MGPARLSAKLVVSSNASRLRCKTGVSGQLHTAVFLGRSHGTCKTEPNPDPTQTLTLTRYGICRQKMIHSVQGRVCVASKQLPCMIVDSAMGRGLGRVQLRV